MSEIQQSRQNIVRYLIKVTADVSLSSETRMAASATLHKYLKN